MNKKGFTLVELLAVILILGLLLTIATPNLMKTFNNKKQILYDDTVKEIERFAGVYLVDNPDLYTNISNQGYVNIPTDFLCEDKYLECPLNDPRDNSEINGYVKVTFENNKYVYKFYNEVYINENVLITLQLNGGVVTENQSGSYKEGSVIELYAPTKANATFNSWEVIKGNSTIAANKLTVGSKDSIIYAIYDTWSNLTINLDGGTVSANPSGIYKNGTIVDLEEPTKSGYIFTGWKLVEGDGILSGDSFTVGEKNAVLKATWLANKYTFNIVYQSSSGLSLGGYTTTYDYGTANTIVPIPLTGYITPESQDIVWDSGNLDTITFIYEPIEYTITYNLEGGSATNPESYTIETDTFTLNNPTRNLYTFLGWTGSNLSETSTSVTIEKGTIGNKAYTATWKKDDTSPPTCSLSVTTSGITATYSDTGGSGIEYYGWDSSYSGTKSTSKSLATGIFTYYVKDAAENYNTCSATVIATTVTKTCPHGRPSTSAEQKAKI